MKMKHHKNGFSLVEFSIYLAIFSCLSVFVMEFIARSSLTLRTMNSELQKTFTCLTALDLIAHELSDASAQKNTWHLLDTHAIIWRSLSKEKDIGLCVVDSKLVRIIGNYAAQEKKWISKTTHTIVDSISELVFAFHYVDDLEQVAIITSTITIPLYNHKKYTASRTIALHNKDLLCIKKDLCPDQAS